jgi:hypothetical protein
MSILPALFIIPLTTLLRPITNFKAEVFKTDDFGSKISQGEKGSKELKKVSLII